MILLTKAGAEVQSQLLHNGLPSNIRLLHLVLRYAEDSDSLLSGSQESVEERI